LRNRPRFGMRSDTNLLSAVENPDSFYKD
jgi:hypothetical protein